MNNLDTLINALTEAIAAGEAVPDREQDTGGTCNFDCAIIQLESVPKGLLESGWPFRLSRIRFCGSNKWYFVSPVHYGYAQGFAQTHVAEAISRKLTQLGFKSQVYYQCD